ncbi:TetR/AcrR family transcriptional regulator [Nonomuraea fuscirosea]|uniref:TetR/AcrR family transcriptional regulator n=1 Tax=Nonomuraea fuscirosea TaxID=1291556 RepID=UPI00342CFAEE
MTRKPRADAAHNRRHIVTVARDAFAADGVDLTMREIARRAGLGPATVHRHFPSRTDLVSAVLTEHVARCRADMRAALDDPDPWRALRTTIRHFAERQLRDRGLNEVLFGPRAAPATAFADDRRAQADALAQLVRRARRSGAVRADVSVEDVRVGLAALSSFRSLPPERALTSMRRLEHLLLAGLSPQPKV